MYTTSKHKTPNKYNNLSTTTTPTLRIHHPTTSRPVSARTWTCSSSGGTRHRTRGRRCARPVTASRSGCGSATSESSWAGAPGTPEWGFPGCPRCRRSSARARVLMLTNLRWHAARSISRAFAASDYVGVCTLSVGGCSCFLTLFCLSGWNVNVDW